MRTGHPGGEGERKRRLTVNDRPWGERKTSHGDKTTDDEQEENWIWRTCQKAGKGEGKMEEMLFTECEDNVERMASRPNEVEAGVDTEVTLHAALGLLLLNHVRLMLFINEVDNV